MLITVGRRHNWKQRKVSRKHYVLSDVVHKHYISTELYSNNFVLKDVGCQLGSAYFAILDGIFIFFYL